MTNFQIYVLLLIPSIILGLVFFKALAFTLPYLEKREAISRQNDLLKEAKKQSQTITNNNEIRVEEQIKLLEEELEEELLEAKEDLKNNEIDLKSKEEDVIKQEELISQKEENSILKQEKLKTLEEALEGLSIKNKEIKTKIINELSSKANLDQNQQLDTLTKNIVYNKEREIQKVHKRNLEDIISNAPKNASIFLRRTLNRYEPDFVWPKPQNIVELNNSAVIDELSKEDSPIIARLKEASDHVNVQFIYEEDNKNKACIKVVGGYGISKEAMRIALESSVNKKSVNWDHVTSLYKTQFNLLEQQALVLGKKATDHLKIPNIHPQIQKLIGALYWRTSYRQNQWHHTVEVATLAGILAHELGEDPEKAKRVGLLHDIGKTLDYKIEGSHAVISCDYADRYGEKLEICETVLSHHDDLIVETPLAYILKAADTFSGARPGARVNLEEGYQIRLGAINEAINSFDGIQDIAIMNGGREVHIITNNKKIAEDDLKKITKEIAKKIEDDVNYPGQIKVVVSRTFESNAVA